MIDIDAIRARFADYGPLLRLLNSYIADDFNALLAEVERLRAIVGIDDEASLLRAIEQSSSATEAMALEGRFRRVRAAEKAVVTRTREDRLGRKP